MAFGNYFELVAKSSAWLRGKTSLTPEIVLVLSGGLDDFVEGMQEKTELSTADIPHFPKSRAEGHAGKLVFGRMYDVPIVVMQGRQHYYEGHAPQDVVFPYFVLNALGAKTLITTNAVGGIRHDSNPGDIMVVTDHINLMGNNPLIGIAMQRKTDQFTSMTNAYDRDLRAVAKETATQKGIALSEGVYAAMMGPSYETPAEIRMLRGMGADAVGMSTVFEVIAANFLGMRVLTFNGIANAAADRHHGVMSHAEVLAAMNAMAPKLVTLLQGVVKAIGKS
ncbi:MAG: purine-nucleoside phosphorylase [Deltaproteobacteria bacterium]|nr:purine-nucleoside phosphorylase [Deltaproteobacteria bacterium]